MKKQQNFAELAKFFEPITSFATVEEVKGDFSPRLSVELRPDLPEALKRAWQLAVFEIESNIQKSPYGGEYFTAGGRGGWFRMLFGQDTTGTALLSLNRLYPEIMREHIRSYVLARLNIGFLSPKGWVPRDCKSAIELDMDVWRPNSREFCERYFMSPALNRTGMDVGWIWAAGDLFDVCGDKMDWAWLYGMGELFFSHFYSPFYDETDGLYFGQASFIDVGWNGYPLSFGEMATEESRNEAIRIKAPSTNALYVRSMDVMAHAAEVIGKKKEAEAWRQRAERLREAIRTQLRLPDGTFTYYKNKDGSLEKRREALGAAFCVLCDVVTGEDAKSALAKDALCHSKAGVTLFYPFHEKIPRSYHNRSAWPFATTFYYLAWEKATGESKLLEDAEQLACAITVPDTLRANDAGELDDYRTGTFKEYIRWEDGVASGTNAQSWTVSAFLNFAIRAGLLNREFKKSRFL